jgi:hypothetical protein
MDSIDSLGGLGGKHDVDSFLSKSGHIGLGEDDGVEVAFSDVTKSSILQDKIAKSLGNGPFLKDFDAAVQVMKNNGVSARIISPQDAMNAKPPQVSVQRGMAPSLNM